jgi:hypothetical protein
LPPEVGLILVVQVGQFNVRLLIKLVEARGVEPLLVNRPLRELADRFPKRPQ